MFFKDSYDEGKKTEDKYFDFFKEHFNDPNLKQTNRFSTFDFSSDTITIELKKRNFKSDKYADYMIGLNKIEKAKKSKKEIYFIMDFDDGLFSYKYNENDKLNYRTGGRRDRGINEFKQYCYIPTELFTKIK
jgi:hypothetical protein